MNYDSEFFIRIKKLQVDQLFGVSKNETEKLWAGILNNSLSENSLRFIDDFQATKPLFSIISEKTLSCSTLSQIQMFI